MALLRRSFLPPGRRVRPGFMAFLSLGCACAAMQAAAQQGPVVIGGSGQPAVVVNLDALERLGGPGDGARLHLVMPQAEVAVVEPGQFGAAGIPPMPTERPYGTLAVVTPPLPIVASAVPVQPTVVTSSTSTAAAASAAAAVPEPEPVPAATVAPEPEPETLPAQPLPESVTASAGTAVEAPEPTLPALPEATQDTAALEPTGNLDLATPGVALSVPFATGEADVAAEAQAPLSQLAASLGADEAVRIQLMAFADGTGTNVSQARRLSLTRALAVRAYLLQKGVRSTRIDVRALGAEAQGGAPDRVDVVVLPR